MKGQTSSRDDLIHQARVFLHQARAFRLRGSEFSAVLLEWAGNARRMAAGATNKQPEPTGQMDMFA